MITNRDLLKALTWKFLTNACNTELSPTRTKLKLKQYLLLPLKYQTKLYPTNLENGALKYNSRLTHSILYCGGG